MISSEDDFVGYSALPHVGQPLENLLIKKYLNTSNTVMNNKTAHKLRKEALMKILIYW